MRKPIQNMTPTPSELAVEPFINTRELAQRVGRKLRTVDEWMRRGFVPYFKIGRTVAFKWSDVESHLAQTCRVCRQDEGKICPVK